MLELRGPLLIVSIVLVAFIWGYKKDAIHASMASRPEVAQPVDAADPAQPPAPPVVIPQMNQQAFPPRNARQPVPPPTPPGTPSRSAKQPPPNPYEALSQRHGRPAAAPVDFNKTFDSIRRNSIDPQQTIQKNAYFRKLSEQLKELRGDSEQAPASTPDKPQPPNQPPSGDQPPPRPLANAEQPDDTAPRRMLEEPMNLEEEELAPEREEEAFVEELDEILGDEAN